MTKEQIIEALKAAAKPYESYYIADDIRQAMMCLPQPFELVEPILQIIESNPTVDFGAPGDLVRYVECFYKKGYEELLIASVRRNPTAHNIWMLHRCYNDKNNPIHNKFADLVNDLKNDCNISAEIKAEIANFTW